MTARAIPVPKLAKIAFTEEEEKLISGAAYAAWNECAYDVLQAVAEDTKHKNINRVTIPRSHAIEIGLDAGRAEQLLKSDLKHGRAGVTQDLLDRMHNAPYKQLIKFCVKHHFTYTRYGM